MSISTTLFAHVCPYNHIFNQDVYQKTFYFVIENMSNDQSISLMALVFYIKISQVKQDCITFDVKKSFLSHSVEVEI